MAITWNNIAAPNFGAANELFKQAQDNLLNVGATLTATAKGYQDAIRKRNLGLIQEYVNSAKSPEELQSEGFQAGLAKLTGGMGGEYDTLAKAQLVDKAYDSLLSRKANQVSISRNEFGLTQDQLEANQKQAISNIFAINDPVMRQAAIDQAVKDKQFNSSLYLQTLAAELTGKTNQQAYDFNAETWDTRKEALTLGNDATRNRMKNDDRAAATAEMNAQTNRIQAEAAAAKAEAERKEKQNAYISTGVAAIDAAKQKVIQQVYGSGLNTDGSKTLGEWVRLKKEEGNDPLPEYIQYLITSHPKLKGLPENIQSLYATKVYNEFSDRRALYNPVGWMTDANKEKVQSLLTNVVQDFEQQVKTAEANATTPLYRKLVLEHAQKTGANAYAAAKDLGLDELTIYKSGIPSQLAAEAKIKYASSDKSIPEDQFIENEINIATNPDYASLNKPLFPEPKQEAASVPAQSSSNFLNKLGTSLPAEKVALINEQLKQTNDPIQIAFLENELRKAEQSKPVKQATTTTTTAPQGKSGTPLQQIALPPSVNKLISTPLDIVTNPSTIKTKPVADPLRQAALEQPPVPTNNTSQPRQLPPAKIAQKERKEQPFTFTDTPLKVLTDAAKLKEATLPVVPAIAVKPEEVKSRELTPAEIAQGERMQQAALSNLIGAKLKEKQAEVQKQFPDTPLKQLAKAATPVPSPLIPVESQNAYKVKENNLVLDFRTGKSTPTKDPVPMPKVTWKEPVQAVTINPIYAQLPQHRVVATFVPDGDTINATSDTYKTKGERAKKAGGIICRIDSIEAPETAKPQYGKKGQPYGEEAAKILQKMVLNKEISIRVTKPTDGESNYGRDVCQVEIAGKDVSVELIREGAAWVYKEYNHYGQGGFDLEATARQSKLGLWGLPNPIYPPDFRHNGYQNP